MKKIIIIILTVSILITGLMSNVYAIDTTFSDQRQQIKEKIQEKTEERNNVFQQVQENFKENMASASALFKQLKSGRIAITEGESTAINGLTLTIKKDDSTYTVFTDDKTQFRRKFWGKSELSEFSVGDKLNIIGTWKDEAKTQIQARFIRNLSIQRRHGVFIGTVSDKTDSGFKFTTVARGVQQVTVIANAEYTNRKGGKITYADIANGHRVKIRGLWDSTKSTITDVTKIKDFDLPVRVNPAASSKAE